MDESLLDFQESKKFSKATKEVKKPTATKKQQKRTTKKEKGQKDIRTALKSKKDDLLSYTKEFRNVCLESGVDIDSEQLQLAIALSKSLQQDKQPEPSTSRSQKNEECLGRNRINKIRSTLLEYGFSVPEIKKTAVKKRARKYRKNSKLLLATDEEKKQKIADKLSQIIFESCADANISITADTSDHTDANINFYKLTGQTFDLLKDDKCFYTANLLEIGPNTVGCLLKDWSEIPGRPISPAPVVVDDQHFTEFIDNQDDLDVLLSSTMNVVKRLVDALKREKELESPEKHVEDEIIIADDADLKDNLENTINKHKSFHNNPANILKSKNTLKIIAPVVHRSGSPDLFEDETDDISINQSVPLSKSLQTLNGYENIPPITTLLSDHMSNESLTDINAKSIETKVILQNIECKIDLTQDQKETMQNSLPPEICVDDIEEVDEIETVQNSQTYDLTQSSESLLDSLPDVHLTNNSEKVSKSTLNIFSPSHEVIEKETKYEYKYSEINNSDCDLEIDPCASNDNDIDLTQESSSPEVVTHTFSNKIEISSNKSGLFDDFTFHHSSLSENNSSKELTHLQDIELNRETSNHNEPLNGNDKIDLTQEVNNLVVDKVNFDSHKTNNGLVNDGISLDSSNESTNENEEKTIEYGDYDSAQFEPALEKEVMVDDIDLKNHHEFDGNTERIQEIADMTIELDLTVDENVSCVNVIPERTSSSSKENSTNVQNGDVLAASQSSENVFEISDEELDYSMQYFRKCKRNSSNYSNQGTPIKQQENPHFDHSGSSILDLIHSNRPSSSCFAPNHSISHNARRRENISYDSFLPAVEIKGTKVKIKSPEPTNIPGTSSTPVRKSEVCNVVTPGNTEYIVKTSNVTPMLDYAALDTPQVNKELDKYGIKPFKRKRAIQLLEHIYYQTHPIVEKCDLDYLETPEKRHKVNEESQDTNIADLENLSQELDSNLIENKAKGDDGNDNKIYEIDTLSPLLKSIPCSSEDWIFQKKEKAKVHGCRVPLHVAFHNYVSARSLLREAILRYEPISIDIVHKQLVKDGHRYDPKDLLKFMNKKCITVKTVDNNGRNGIRKSQRKS